MPFTYADSYENQEVKLSKPYTYDKQIFTVGNVSWELRILSVYRLELMARIAKPRMLKFASDNNLYVGSSVDRLYRFKPPYTKSEVFAQLQDYPHDIAFRGKQMFVARSNGIYQTRYPVQTKIPLQNHDFTLLVSLPVGGGHSSRSIGIGPNNRLYASLGISGNCDNQYLGDNYQFKDWRGGILVLDENEKNNQWQVYASGLRNPIGFDWHPETKVLYASNNGPDHLGYAWPREYFSRIDKGSFYGMPWFWWKGDQLIRDTCIRVKPPRTDVSRITTTFPARNAPMAVAFVPYGKFHQRMSGNAVVALHGSWATQPDGEYFGRLSSRRPPWLAVVVFRKGEAYKVLPLLEGLQNPDGKRLARPVGLAFSPSGDLYFTSDGGVIQGLFKLKKK